MSKAPFWPVATDALVADTLHLSSEQFGAYVLLMVCQWRNNGMPLNDDTDKLARIVRLTPARFKKIWPEISQFFEQKDGKISQKRLEEDFKNILKKIIKNIHNGGKGGRANALKIKEARLANALNSLGSPLEQNSSDQGSGDDTNQNQNQNPNLSEGEVPSNKGDVSNYAFEGIIIKLNTKDYKKWKEIYPSIPDFRATLYSADAWIAGKTEKEQKKWFPAVSQYLNNQHQKHLNDERRHPLPESPTKPDWML